VFLPPSFGSVRRANSQKKGTFTFVAAKNDRVASKHRGRAAAKTHLRKRQREFPLFLTLQIIGDQPIRAEVCVDALAVGDRRGGSGGAQLVHFFDRGGRHSGSPLDLPFLRIHGDDFELLRRKLKGCEEQTMTPYARRRVS